MKATHFGTCQICNRKMKAPNGVLSNHGYTVENGYFSGSCHGSHELPFEVDREVLGQVIQEFSDYIEANRKHMIDVDEDKTPYLVPLWVQKDYNLFGYTRPKQRWVNYTSVKEVPYEWDTDRNYYVFTIDSKELGELFLYNMNDNYKYDDNGMIEFTDKIDNVFDRNTNIGKERYRLKLSYAIHNDERTLKSLQTKYDEWTPKELDPIN